MLFKSKKDRAVGSVLSEGVLFRILFVVRPLYKRVVDAGAVNGRPTDNLEVQRLQLVERHRIVGPSERIVFRGSRGIDTLSLSERYKALITNNSRSATEIATLTIPAAKRTKK